MDEWNNQSFIIWRTRNSGNTVRERGVRKSRDGDEDEEKGKVQKEEEWDSLKEKKE